MKEMTMRFETDAIRQTFTRVGMLAETEWGSFRRFISANPLTGFWCGAVFGAVVAGPAMFQIVWFAVWLFS
jgi:uncharacterized membrane protein